MDPALQNAEEIKAAAMNALGDSSTPNDNGEPTPPPSDPPAPTPDATPSAAPTPPATKVDDEAGKKDWTVPGERLQEEVEKRKKLEAEQATKDARIAELEAAANAKPSDDADDDDADDDDTEVILKSDVKKAIEKEGFVRADKVDQIVESKIAAREQAAADRQQAVQDKTELTSWTKDKGYPEFNLDEVLPRATELFGDKLNKAALRAAYMDLHESDIENVLIKQANATRDTPSASAERPGGSPNVAGDSPKTGKDAAIDRIAAVVPD